MMKILRKLRNSELWRMATDDELRPDADLISSLWRASPAALAVAVISIAILIVLALGFPVPAAAPMGQLCLFVAALFVVPTAGCEFVYRRWGANPPTSIVGFVMLTLSWPNGFLALLAGPRVPPVREMLDWAGMWGYVAAGWMAAMSCWLILVVRSHILGQLREQVARERSRADVATHARQLAEAKLQTLQAQIEPHFLYNTLANAQALVAKRPADAEAMLNSLIRYLREAVPKMRDKCSTLQQEFALAQAYLDIARIRFGERLTVEVSLPVEITSMEFPPLIIQTLVENALKHGAEPKVGPVRIALRASLEGTALTVTVTDDGAGFNPTQDGGVGLRNTRERLRAIYGDAATLQISPNAPSGVRAAVLIEVERP